MVKIIHTVSMERITYRGNFLMFFFVSLRKLNLIIDYDTIMDIIPLQFQVLIDIECICPNTIKFKFKQN